MAAIPILALIPILGAYKAAGATQSDGQLWITILKTVGTIGGVIIGGQPRNERCCITRRRSRQKFNLRIPAMSRLGGAKSINRLAKIVGRLLRSLFGVLQSRMLLAPFGGGKAQCLQLFQPRFDRGMETFCILLTFTKGADAHIGVRRKVGVTG